jgi:hypothetical protein
MRLGAGEAVAFFASAAVCGSKDGSRGACGDETGLGAGAGEEWSGVRNVSVGGCCGETGRERVCAEVGEDAGVGLCGEGNGGEYRGGRDAGRRPCQCLLAAPPRSAFLPPSSSAWRAGARVRGPSVTRMAMVGAVADRPAGAQAGSDVLGAAIALQHWQPDRDDGGVGGGISRLRQWRLEFCK